MLKKAVSVHHKHTGWFASLLGDFQYYDFVGEHFFLGSGDEVVSWKMFFLFVWLSFFFTPWLSSTWIPPNAHLNNIHQTACPGFDRTTSWLKTTSWIRMFSFKRSRDAGIFEVVISDCRMVENHRRDGVAWHSCIQFACFFHRRMCLIWQHYVISCCLVSLDLMCTYMYIINRIFVMMFHVFIFSLRQISWEHVHFVFQSRIDWLIDWLIEWLIDWLSQSKIVSLIESVLGLLILDVLKPEP